MNDLDITVTSLSADEEMRVMQLFSQAPFSEEELQAQLAAHDAREQRIFTDLRYLTKSISATVGAQRVALERQRSDVLDSLAWLVDKRERICRQILNLKRVAA